MAGFGDQVEDAVLNCVLRGVPYPFPAGTLLSLHTANPGDTGLFEVAGNAYFRQPVTWNAPSGGVATTTADVDFNGMPATTVLFFGVWTLGGQFAGGGPAPAATLLLGDSYRIYAGTTFQLD